MADFTALKTAIQTYIKENGNEEITGEKLQEILLSMVTTLGDSAINDLVIALANEVAARQNADGTLQQNITNEATARGNADTALGGRIDDEATARANGDTALSDRLGSSITAENTAANQIGAEAEARAAADTALQGLIDGITDNIENGYVYAGIATPSSTPATGKVFYLALTAGTYTNFGSTVVSQGINILKYNGSAWSLDAFIGIDDVPTPSSTGIPKSGGTFDFVMKNGSAFDISAHFASGGTLATYADLSAALTALNTLPAAYKRGGMSIRFVRTSDNKYVRYNLIANEFTTDVTKWAVDDDGIYINNSEWLYVTTDSNKQILGGFKADGSFEFSKGVPKPIKDFITGLLLEKVDKESGKSLIDINISNSLSYDDIPEYREIELDSAGNILGGRKNDFTKFENTKYKIKEVQTEKLYLSDEGLNKLFNDFVNSGLIIPSDDELPSYYADYMEDRVTKINKERFHSNGYSDSIIFITDVHVESNSMKSPLLIKTLLNDTTINKVVFGGDIVSAYGDDSLMEQQASIFTKEFYPHIHPLGHLYCLMGNHDFTIRESSSSDNGNTFPVQYTRNVLMSREDIDAQVITDTSYPDSIYYYFDNKNQKIRHIILNSTDSVNEGEPWGTKVTFSKRQSDFIAEAMNNCPSGYKIVLYSHISPINPHSGDNLWPMNPFVNAAYTKGSVRIYDTDYDFSNCPDIIALICGHWHLDFVLTTEVGLPIICTACDAEYVDYTASMFNNEFGGYPSKTEGTIYEQTFDCFIVDASNQTLNAIRIGGGYDRKINAEHIELQQGNTTQLSTSINNPSWRIYDYNSLCVNTGGTYQWNFTNNYATISNAGVVSGVSEGIALACAINPTTKEMEYFIININN